MLYCTASFLLIAVVAALLGFGVLAAGAAGIAKFLCMVFAVMTLSCLLGCLVRRNS